MENKKLIKQLEKCGFEKDDKDGMRLVFEGMRFMWWKNKLDVLTAGPNGKFVETREALNLTQTKEVVMEHTGFELKPKRTKREEIEELKKQLKKFNSNFENYRVFSEGTKDELKERIEQLEEKTKGLNLEYRFDPESKTTKSPVKEIAIVHQGEMILNKKAIKSMQGMCDKQASEMQAEEAKGIEVGDPVVLEGHSSWSTRAKAWIKKGCVFNVLKTDLEDGHGVHLSLNDIPVVYEDNGKLHYCVFFTKRLQHAPKEAAKGLKFADLMELLETFVEIETGEIVVFINKSKEGNYNVVDKGGEKHCLHPRYLKRL